MTIKCTNFDCRILQALILQRLIVMMLYKERHAVSYRVSMSLLPCVLIVAVQLSVYMQVDYFVSLTHSVYFL